MRQGAEEPPIDKVELWAQSTEGRTKGYLFGFGNSQNPGYAVTRQRSGSNNGSSAEVFIYALIVVTNLLLTMFVDYVSNFVLQVNELKEQMERMQQHYQEQEAIHAAELAQ